MTLWRSPDESCGTVPLHHKQRADGAIKSEWLSAMPETNYPLPHSGGSAASAGISHDPRSPVPMDHACCRNCNVAL